MAKDCLILPPAPADLPVIERMIETALKAGPQHLAWTYFQNAKGLSEYRQGHFDKALQCMQQVVKVPGDPRRSAEAYAVLAMTQHQLRNLLEATNAFGKALEIERTEFSKINSSYPDPDWNDQLIAKALIQEAKTMLEKEQAPDD
jgi:tetratricopeptide (TPR) repeat protein